MAPRAARKQRGLPRGSAPATSGCDALSRVRFLVNETSVTRPWLPAGPGRRAQRAPPLWRHVRAACSARLSGAHRSRVVDAFVWPILAYRAPARTPTPWLLSKAGSLQRWCIAQAADIFFLPGEDAASFNRRRARSAGALARQAGLWSARIVAAAQRMLETVRAEAPPRTWAARLVSVRGEAWARERRKVCGSDSVFLGRLA